MEFSAAQIAKMINGTIEGDSDVIISKFSKIEEADIGSLTFLANTKYSEYLYTTKASIIIINKDFELKSKVSSTLIRVPDAYSSVAFLLDLYNKNIENKQGIEQPSFISSSAKIGENVYIGAFSYIGENVKIGNNSKIYPNTHVADNSVVGDGTILYQGVKLYRNSQVGNNCIIHAGVVIGADGFGFAPDKNNVYHKVPQTGNVIIEDNVEIGANSCVDKATLGSTIIRKGVKIDNLVMIAHNVEIKENTVIVAQTGISGSVKIGKNCIIGGQVGIAGHLTIADEVKIQAQSGIASSINEKASVVQGSPAFNIMDFKRAYVLFRKLPKLFSKLD